ncbi:MAG: hypothetical protein R3Y47_12950 [Lachnospiraceae bacterium]
MMKKIRTIFKDKKAESTPLTIALILGILLISLAMTEFFRLTIIVQGVRDTLQSSVISVATSNYDEVYNGLREGYSGGYKLSGSTWVENIDYYDVYDQLDETLGTVSSGGYHIKENEEGYEFRFNNLQIDIDNTALTPGNADTNFEVDVSIDIEIPLSFGWSLVPPLQMEVRTKAVYMPLF